jgi:uncharacterized protein YkwD
MRRIALLLALAGVLVTALATAAPSEATLSSSADPAIEQQMLQMLNAYRAQHGLVALRSSPNLVRAARFHSRDMTTGDYFDHTSPDGEQFQNRLTRFGFRWRSAGEAIGMASGLEDAPSAADSAIEMWQQSPPHNKILLTAGYRSVGIGVWCAPGDDGSATCMFTLDAARAQS